MRGSKRRHLTAPECQALAQSPEGLSPLRQPLSLARGRGGRKQSLHPPQSHPRGQQRNILDFFRISKPRQLEPAGMQNTKEEPQDLIFPASPPSFSSNSSLFLNSQHSVPSPKKRTLPAPSSEQDLGEGNEEKIPKISGIKQEWEELEVEQDVGERTEQKIPKIKGIKQEWEELEVEQDVGERNEEKIPKIKGIKQEWEELEVEQDVGKGNEQKIPKIKGIKQEWEELEVEPLPDSHFGLLGTRNWEVPQGSINDLPAEILRNIFAFLPVLDLYQNLSLVCHSWREIIRDPQFIPWKKLYHSYLRGEEGALQRVQQLLQQFCISREQQECVLGLVRLVASMGPKVDPSGVLQILGTHPLFPKAQLCVLNKFPDLQRAEQLWAVVAVLVLFSGTVGDIQRVLGCFGSPQCRLGVLEVTEVLHCLATLLRAARDRGVLISNRIHYNILYCLSLMENSRIVPVEEGRVNLSCSGGADIKLTHEQQRILNHRIEPGQTVKIMAFAGTGKTSTLVKYTEKFQELQFLYLAFNKAVAEKGKRVFPRNVTCKTFHSLAFGSVGRLYKAKGKLNFSKLSVYSISLLLQHREGQSLYVRAKMVSRTLENFFASSDRDICEEHAPLWYKNTQGQLQLMDREDKRISVEEAKQIWHHMQQLDGDTARRYKMTCDGYLKLWQLSKPQLSGFDAILVDEAQDCTPAIVDIVQSQSCGKLLVGDPHQQIYSFRGAVNTLHVLPHSHLFYLSQSFRFGPEIAYVGSTILEVCKGIRGKTLLGGSHGGDVRGARQGQVALLSRSNFNVFEDAVEFSGRAPPVKIHIIGGLEKFGLSRIYDIWKLSQPAEVRKNSQLQIEDPFLRRWEQGQGFLGLKEFALRTDDANLQGKICIVEKHGDRIPELLQRIQESHVGQQGQADFLMGTVHQAKGLEFDTVCVADDFAQIPSVTGAFLRSISLSLGRTPEDEWNLLYVAVTRAKRCLLLSQSLENLLSLAGERFLRVELPREAGKDKDGAAVTCCMSGCTKSLEFSTGLLVKKLPLTHLTNGRGHGLDGNWKRGEKRKF
ncbi:F-box DNA helicase 1 isoform X2 [Catharus ustulatus]|uniref:F-box DNA helicase 1 isoform X2 n=1 Tax=Catharus ustulatus TaxID=91951 RepID=UPI001407BF66|nr:F-box DNA helicase 1 isoform X2 [Catharus ustulatus]